MGWFRVHDGTSEDAKWRCISDDTGVTVAAILGVWTALLDDANSDKHPGIALRGAEILARILRVTVTDMHKVLTGMERYRCIERDGDTIYILNWKRRQFADSAAAIRMRRYRQRRKTGNSAGRPPRGVTGDRNGSYKITETDSDSDSDSDHRRNNDFSAPVTPSNGVAIGHAEERPSKRKRRGTETPIPDSWEPRADEYAYGQERGLSRFDVMREADRFTNHARQNDRRCVDWNAAFRNWLLKAIDMRNSANPKKPTAGREGILP